MYSKLSSAHLSLDFTLLYKKRKNREVLHYIILQYEEPEIHLLVHFSSTLNLYRRHV